MQQDQFVAVSQHPYRGQILVATRDLQPQQRILREAPLITAAANHSLGIWSAFQAASPELQHKVLHSFYSPVDGAKGQDSRALLSSPQSHLSDKRQLETCLKAVMAFHFNSVVLDPARGMMGPVGLFPTQSRAAHSCQPNCVYFIEPGTRDTLVVQTITSVVAGQELTVSYMEDEFLLRPAHERRAELLARREFSCDCPRCTAPGDDTRRFRCTCTAGCAGQHLAQQLGDQAALLACSGCGKQPAAAVASRLLREEADMVRTVTCATSILDRGRRCKAALDVAVPMIRHLKPPHPHHALAAKLGLLHWQMHFVVGEDRQAATALRAVIACLEGMSPVPVADVSVNYQLLATTLEHGGRRLAREAHEASRKAVQLQRLPNRAGPEKERQLLAIQERMSPAEAAALSSLGSCSFCGGGRADGGPLAKCGRCQRAAYCCREHQQMQWPLHKKSCKAAAAAAPPNS